MFSFLTAKSATVDPRNEFEEFPQTFDLPDFAAIAAKERRAAATLRDGKDDVRSSTPHLHNARTQEMAAFGAAALPRGDQNAGRVLRDASLICLVVIGALALGILGATLTLAAYGAVMLKLFLDARRDGDEDLQTVRLHDPENLYSGLLRSLFIGVAAFHLAHKVFLGLPVMAAPWGHLANIALWSAAPLAALAALLPAALALRVAAAIALVSAGHFLLVGGAASLLLTDFTWGAPGRSYILLLADIFPAGLNLASLNIAGLNLAGALPDHLFSAEAQKTLLANPTATATISAVIAGPAIALAVRQALSGWVLNRTGFSVIAATALAAEPLVWLGAVNLGLVNAESASRPTILGDAARHIATFAPITFASCLLRAPRKEEIDG